MAKQEKCEEMLHVPLPKSMKRKIVDLADAEERKPADMGRVLWREALNARKQLSESRSVAAK